MQKVVDRYAAICYNLDMQQKTALISNLIGNFLKATK
jgi:hypothetical protein